MMEYNGIFMNIEYIDEYPQWELRHNPCINGMHLLSIVRPAPLPPTSLWASWQLPTACSWRTLHGPRTANGHWSMATQKIGTKWSLCDITGRTWCIRKWCISSNDYFGMEHVDKPPDLRGVVWSNLTKPNHDTPALEEQKRHIYPRLAMISLQPKMLWL